MSNQILNECRYNHPGKWSTRSTGIVKSTLLFLLLFVVSFTQLLAQTITVDGNPADWPAVLNSSSSSLVKSFVHDASKSNDNQFTQGNSDVLIIEKWDWNNGSTNNKGDILNTGAALIGGKLYFFGDRFAVNGDAQIGFWFFHDNVAPLPNGKFSGTHKVGDLLILSNFTNGGGGVNISVFKWVGTGGALGGGTFDSIPVGGQGGADVNDQNYPVPTTVTDWSYSSKSGPANTYVVGSFFEGYVDLVAIGADPCFQSFLMETRNSQSVTASQQDMATGQFKVVPDVNLSATLKTGLTAGNPQPGCPKVYNIDVNATTTASLTATGAATYTWVATHSDGSAIGSEATFSGNSNGTATFTINNINATQFTYRIIVTGSIIPGCEDKDTICIQPTGSAPTCNISGPSPVCPKTTNTYIYDPDNNKTADALPANFTAAWTLENNTNNATINPPLNGNSVTVTAGTACATAYTVKLTLTSTSGLTTITCTKTVSVNVNATLVLNCPKDTTLSCGASTAPATTGTATAADNGCGVKVSYTDVITRTWTAVDACGNTKTCTQTITVPGPCVTSDNLPSSARIINSDPTILAPAVTSNTVNAVKDQPLQKIDKPAVVGSGITALNTGLQVQAFPNPFSNTINFRFVSATSGRAVLEVFNTTGQLVGIAFDGKVDAGVSKNVQFNTRFHNQALIYRLKVGAKMVKGTVLELNK